MCKCKLALLHNSVSWADRQMKKKKRLIQTFHRDHQTVYYRCWQLNSKTLIIFYWTVLYNMCDLLMADSMYIFAPWWILRNHKAMDATLLWYKRQFERMQVRAFKSSFFFPLVVSGNLLLLIYCICLRTNMTFNMSHGNYREKTSSISIERNYLYTTVYYLFKKMKLY